MTLAQLEAFVAVVEERHFGRAAARLGVTTSSLSKRLQELERSLGLRLFERTSRHVEPTPAAGLLLDQARRTLAEATTFRAIAGAATAGKAGRVSLIHALHHAEFVTELLRHLATALPDVQLDYRERPGGSIGAEVLAGEASLGLCSGAVPLGLRAFCFDVLTFDCVFVPRGHRLAERAEVVPTDFDGEVFLRAGPDLTILWRDFGARVETKVVPMAGREEVANRIEQGEGLVLTSSRAVAAFSHRAVVALPLGDPASWGSTEQFLAWRADDDSPLVAAVVAEARAIVDRRSAGRPRR